MNSIAYFEIQSSLPAREIAFYESVFGWSFIRESIIPTEYYRIETGGMRGGLFRRPASVPMPVGTTNAFTCSMEVSDFDKTELRILEAGGKVVLPKFPIPGRCWQGYYRDTDNNVFGIFQPDANAK